MKLFDPIRNEILPCNRKQIRGMFTRTGMQSSDFWIVDATGHHILTSIQHVLTMKYPRCLDWVFRGETLVIPFSGEGRATTIIFIASPIPASDRIEMAIIRCYRALEFETVVESTPSIQFEQGQPSCLKGP